MVVSQNAALILVTEVVRIRHTHPVGTRAVALRDPQTGDGGQFVVVSWDDGAYAPDLVPLASVAPVTIPVGREQAEKTVVGVRTPQQRATALAIAERREFAYALTNPFTELARRATGSFMLMWYDRSRAQVVGTRIAPDGTIVREVRSSRDPLEFRPLAHG